MSWAILLLVLCEIAQEDAAQSKKRAVRAAEKKRESSDSPNPSDGGVLEAASEEVSQEMIQRCFNKLWATNACWASSVFDDALAFARKSEPRDEDILYRALDSTAIPGSGTPLKQDEISSLFVQNVWPSLKTRGWKAAVLSDGPHAGKTQYSYEGKQVRTGLISVLFASVLAYPFYLHRHSLTPLRDSFLLYSTIRSSRSSR